MKIPTQCVVCGNKKLEKYAGKDWQLFCAPFAAPPKNPRSDKTPIRDTNQVHYYIKIDENEKDFEESIILDRNTMYQVRFDSSDMQALSKVYKKDSRDNLCEIFCFDGKLQHDSHDLHQKINYHVYLYNNDDKISFNHWSKYVAFL